MDDARKKAWAVAAARLDAVWPSLGLLENPDKVRIWDDLLGDLTPEQIARASHHVARDYDGPPPKPAILRQVVRGRTVRVPIHATDCWGRRIVSGSGYCLAGFTEIHVPWGDEAPEYVLEHENRALKKAIDEVGGPMLEESYERLGIRE